jgi:hypothetical protein
MLPPNTTIETIVSRLMWPRCADHAIIGVGLLICRQNSGRSNAISPPPKRLKN